MNKIVKTENCGCSRCCEEPEGEAAEVVEAVEVAEAVEAKTQQRQ